MCKKNDHINFGNGLCNGEKRQICDMLTSMLIHKLFAISKILQVEKDINLKTSTQSSTGIKTHRQETSS